MTVPTKKKLLVLDVNGLLVETFFQAEKRPEDRPHDGKVGRFFVYRRPYCNDFLKFCFENFEVGIWSSAQWHNVEKLVDFIFGHLKKNLLFAWHQADCTDTGLKTPENRMKPVFLKELSKLWSKLKPDLPWEEGDYGPFNTLLIDDTPYKAMRNPPHTAIFPYPYKVSNDPPDDALGGSLREYLEGLSSAPNVQDYVQHHPFGQPPISRKSPNWNFYHKILFIKLPMANHKPSVQSLNSPSHSTLPGKKLPDKQVLVAVSGPHFGKRKKKRSSHHKEREEENSSSVVGIEGNGVADKELASMTLSNGATQDLQSDHGQCFESGPHFAKRKKRRSSHHKERKEENSSSHHKEREEENSSFVVGIEGNGVADKELASQDLQSDHGQHFESVSHLAKRRKKRRSRRKEREEDGVAKARGPFKAKSEDAMEAPLSQEYEDSNQSLGDKEVARSISQEPDANMGSEEAGLSKTGVISTARNNASTLASFRQQYEDHNELLKDKEVAFQTDKDHEGYSASKRSCRDFRGQNNFRYLNRGHCFQSKHSSKQYHNYSNHHSSIHLHNNSYAGSQNSHFSRRQFQGNWGHQNGINGIVQTDTAQASTYASNNGFSSNAIYANLAPCQWGGLPQYFQYRHHNSNQIQATGFEGRYNPNCIGATWIQGQSYNRDQGATVLHDPSYNSNHRRGTVGQSSLSEHLSYKQMHTSYYGAHYQGHGPIYNPQIVMPSCSKFEHRRQESTDRRPQHWKNGPSSKHCGRR